MTAAGSRCSAWPGSSASFGHRRRSSSALELTGTEEEKRKTIRGRKVQIVQKMVGGGVRIERGGEEVIRG